MDVFENLYSGLLVVFYETLESVLILTITLSYQKIVRSSLIRYPYNTSERSIKHSNINSLHNPYDSYPLLHENGLIVSMLRVKAMTGILNGITRDNRLSVILVVDMSYLYQAYRNPKDLWEVRKW